MRARSLWMPCLLGATFVALLVLPGTAGAAFLTPEYEMTFAGAGANQIGEATAVAVDETSHDVYVTDRANHRVEKFDSGGNFLLAWDVGANPTAIVVDNSGGPSQGSVYVADGTFGGGDGTIAKFDPEGHPVPAWGEDGKVTVVKLQKVGISPVDGAVWVLDGEVSGSPGGVAGAQVSAYEPEDGFQRFRREQKADTGGDGSIAVDLHDRLWFSDHNLTPLKEDITRFKETEMGALGRIDPGVAGGFTTNPVSGDVLAVFNFGEVTVFEDSCEPARGYCTPKESFGAGYLSSPRALAVDGSDYSVYVAVEGGIAVFRSKVVPDVVPKPASVGHTDAVLTAHLDPVGAGDIVGCEVDYGTTNAYGTTVPCEQALPMTQPGDATVHLSGLETESVYHYRFRASNGNGTSIGPDRTFTPHWVAGLETGDATDIGPGTATLHGELNPSGESTHYYFEWGETKSYGHQSPAIPGTETSAGTLTQVEMSLAGMLTSATTYHYRLVAVNGLGTSRGSDREFTTPLSDPPQIRNVLAAATGLTTATLHAELNPGFGNTAYRFQYGPALSYGNSTPIVGPFGNDGSFHSVAADISGLSPGTTYHFRVIVFNFVGHVSSSDAVFTTPTVPAIGEAAASVLNSHSVRLSARAGAPGTTTTIHFEYGVSPGYGGQSASAPVGPDGLASVIVTGLSPSTTYHFRLVATNEFGEATGGDQVFTTPAEPSTGTPHPKKCKRGFVRRKGKCVKQHRGHRHNARRGRR